MSMSEAFSVPFYTLIKHKSSWVIKFGPSSRCGILFSSVQSLSRVRLFATPRIAARQASPSITNSRSLPKPMSIESVMPSSHLILCRPLLLLHTIFLVSGFFSVTQFFASGAQSTGASASASFLPMNTQNWFSLGLTVAYVYSILTSLKNYQSIPTNLIPRP